MLKKILNDGKKLAGLPGTGFLAEIWAGPQSERAGSVNSGPCTGFLLVQLCHMMPLPVITVFKGKGIRSYCLPQCRDDSNVFTVSEVAADWH